jgi:hypothetical protein
MRHGRKTKSQRIDGYKRHVLTDLDTELVCAVGVTAANVAEAEVADQITADLDAQQRTLEELDIDRGLLTCPNSVTVAFVPGGKVQFPATTCQVLPAARPVHQQHPRPQRADPPRRDTAGRVARPPADPPRASQAA